MTIWAIYYILYIIHLLQRIKARRICLLFARVSTKWIVCGLVRLRGESYLVHTLWRARPLNRQEATWVTQQACDVEMSPTSWLRFRTELARALRPVSGGSEVDPRDPELQPASWTAVASTPAILQRCQNRVQCALLLKLQTSEEPPPTSCILPQQSIKCDLRIPKC